MSFYVCAGLYAEGPSDYQFLLPLLDRVLLELLSRHFPAQHELAGTQGLPDIHMHGRAARIAATISKSWDSFTLFVIHSDGAGDPDVARANTIQPGIDLTQTQLHAAGRQEPLAVAVCMPIRELEAWLLADPLVFVRLGIKGAVLPPDPERVTDPKQALAALLGRRKPPFDFFGEQVSLDALRRLAAFRAFEAELLAALHLLAKPGGR